MKFSFIPNNPPEDISGIASWDDVKIPMLSFHDAFRVNQLINQSYINGRNNVLTKLLDVLNKG